MITTAAVITFMSLKTCVLWLVVHEVLKPIQSFHNSGPTRPAIKSHMPQGYNHKLVLLAVTPNKMPTFCVGKI